MTQKRHRIVLVFATAVGLAVPASAFAADVVAVFRIKGPMTEAPSSMDLGELFGQESAMNMFDLLERLRAARTDSDVQAVVFDIEEAQLGLAQIEELRAQFESLRAAEKDVWVFVETLTLPKMMLGSAASQLWLLPSGDVDIRGLYGEALYFKNLLDNIKVEADIIHCGDYKSAGEPFYRTGPSKEDEEQTNRLLDSIFDELIESVAKSRQLKPTRVRELIDQGMLTAQEALDAKLIDKLAFREDFIEELKTRYGDDVKITRKYGRDKKPKIDLSNPFAFFTMFSDMMKGKKPEKKPTVAVIYVENVITTGPTEESIFGGSSNAGSTTIRHAIAKAAANDDVKALVLRVDSPGGSAVASEIICEAASRFKESGRPFIVSMGNVAASGGYYVSTAADTIFAEPTTITGSIGVVGGKFVTSGLWEWLGVTGHEYKRGKHSDLMNSNRRFTNDERQLVEKWMYRIYDEFKARVMDGRGDKITGDLEPLAGGRVYTGKQAMEIGLVDRLGGMAEAIRFAAGEAQLGSNYEVRIYPERKTFFDKIFEGMSDKDDTEDFVSIRLSPRSRYAALPQIGAALEALGAMDPVKARSLERFLLQMELMTREGVLMIGPACTTTGVPGLN